MKLKELVVDPDRVENGAWVENIPELEGLRLKVRGSGNADWRRMQAKLIDATPRKKRPGGRIDPEEMDRIIGILLVNVCLLDWEGLEGDDGQPLPFSKETAQKLITAPEYRRFREAVSWAANMVADGEEAHAEADAGNLLRLSGGSTAGERKLKAG